MYQLLKQIVKAGIVTESPPQPEEALRQMRQRLDVAILKHFGRSLAIRHVDAGSCNGCELEIHMAQAAHYNLEGLGVRFVAMATSQARMIRDFCIEMRRANLGSILARIRA